MRCVVAERPFKCGECSKSYAQRGALLAHAQAHLPTHARAISLHQCPKCPKVFLYSSGQYQLLLRSDRTWPHGTDKTHVLSFSAAQ